MKRLFFLLVLISNLLVAEQSYTLSICAIFRNEARFLKEWIEYHRMIGVEHFYLFNHLSEDPFEEVLTPYIEEGVVELFHVTDELNSHENWYSDIQCGAYNHILKERREETKWLAVIDTDEFLVLKRGRDLKKFLKSYDEFAGIGVCWQLFGTSNVKRIPEGKTMIGTLLHRAPKRARCNRSVKSIVQPKRVDTFENPHFAKPIKPFEIVHESKIPLKFNPPPFVTTKEIQLNHYTYRDEEFYWGEKVARFLRFWPNHDIERIPEPNPALNEIEDLFMLQYVSELESILLREH